MSSERRSIDSAPNGADRLLACLDAVPRSRSELIQLAELDDDEWYPAIGYAMATGLVARTGAKRGTRYAKSDGRSRVVEQGARATPPASKKRSDSKSFVSSSFHDVVQDVLADLACDDDPTDEQEDEDDLEVCARLTALGLVVIDLREQGGCIWVRDGSRVAAVVEQVALETGVTFRRVESSRACGGGPGWWARV